MMSFSDDTFLGSLSSSQRSSQREHNSLQYCHWGWKKYLFFIKKWITTGMGMGMGCPNPSGTGMGFNFLSPLGMGRVTGKYMRIRDGDGEAKTHPHPAPLSCLVPSRKLYPVKIDFCSSWDLNQPLHSPSFCEPPKGDNLFHHSLVPCLFLYFVLFLILEFVLLKFLNRHSFEQLARLTLLFGREKRPKVRAVFRTIT